MRFESLYTQDIGCHKACSQVLANTFDNAGPASFMPVPELLPVVELYVTVGVNYGDDKVCIAVPQMKCV